MNNYLDNLARNTINVEPPSYILADADEAVDLLTQIIHRKIKQKFLDNSIVPVSRHEIIAKCMSYAQATDDAIRFKTEVILQAVKSRGFFTIEAIGDIERIIKFSKEANRYIHELCDAGVICADTFYRAYPDESLQNGVGLPHDFQLMSNNMVQISAMLLDIWQTSQTSGSASQKRKKIEEVSIDANGDIVRKPLTIKKFLESRLRKILSGTEIEIKGRIDETANWIFSNPHHIRTLNELGSITSQILSKYLSQETGMLKIYGVWSSGEWLFYKDGFAFDKYGQKIIERLKANTAELNLVLIQPHNYRNNTICSKRTMSIFRELGKLNKKIERETGVSPITIRQIPWWKHNRKMTIIKNENGQTESQDGIYFRRRLSSPLVSPVHLTDGDCDALHKLFRHYLQKAAPF